jgi:hypothetical protein
MRTTKDLLDNTHVHVSQTPKPGPADPFFTGNFFDPEPDHTNITVIGISDP